MKSSAYSIPYFFLMWLINPLASALVLFRNMKRVTTITPYLLISFFFGLSFVIIPGSEADSVSYSEELEVTHENFISFKIYFSKLYNEESAKVDIYQPLVTWLVSRFTGNYQWLFGIFAVVFGYFWFKAIRLARLLLPDRLNLFFTLLLLFFALINPIWHINGVRMWTAVGIFFYGLLKTEYLNDKKGYWYLVLPTLVHLSLSVALIVYILFCLFPTKNLKILFVLFILTFFVGELDFEFVRNYFELLPGFVQTRKGYINEEYVERIKVESGQLSAHIQLFAILSRYMILMLICWIFVSFSLIKKMANPNFTHFFGMALVFSAFSNLASQIPSGGRFLTLSNMIVIFCFIWFSSKDINGYVPNTFKKIGIFILSYLVIIQIRIGADFYGILVLLGNPVVNILIRDNIPLIEYIKALF